ncbi:MAG: bifunctional 3'-5' exonuclease/DNA polymerase, partial [Streptosporangiaceae bacterium]
MRVAVVPGPGRSGLLCEIAADGSRAGAVQQAADLPAAIRECELAGPVRWVWPAAAELYPQLLLAGVRVSRCHDIALCEALLLSREGMPGEPASLSAAWARLRGEPVPAVAPAPARTSQQALFEPPQAGGTAAVPASAALEALIAVHAAQLARIA